MSPRAVLAFSSSVPGFRPVISANMKRVDGFDHFDIFADMPVSDLWRGERFDRAFLETIVAGL